MPQINQDTAQYNTLMVQLNNLSDSTCDHLYGLESKKYKLYAASTGANPIVQVQPWTDLTFDLRPLKSAVIENLIIDGQDLGVTGIKLENVYNSWIRNVTIMNCEVGVHVHLKDGGWSEFNHLQHIRMKNVETGILFTTAGHSSDDYPGDSAGFTTIDDVGISLKNDASAVGIQIGDGTAPVSPLTPTNIKPYSSRIKANVWMGSEGGTGLKIMNGELKYGLINLAVQGPSNGIGVNLGSGNEKVYNNQFTDLTTNPIKNGFLLSTGGISSEYGLIWDGKFGTPPTTMPTNDINLKLY